VTENCLVTVERLAPLAALTSLQLLKYLFQSWRLLVHLYVIWELYICEEQRYLSVPYQDDKSLIINSTQRRVFAGRHQKFVTECDTVLSSLAGIQTAFLW